MVKNTGCLSRGPGLSSNNHIIAYKCLHPPLASTDPVNILYTGKIPVHIKINNITREAELMGDYI